MRLYTLFRPLFVSITKTATQNKWQMLNNEAILPKKTRFVGLAASMSDIFQ